MNLARTAIAALTLLALAASPAQAAFPGHNGKLAFSSSQNDGNHEIYVIEPDGTGLTRLTANAAIDFEPAWSPNGKRIAFASSRGAADPTCLNQGFNCDIDVYVMNADGSGVKRLTDTPGRDSEPAWSPDGSRIVFTSLRDHVGPIADAHNSELYVMRSDGRRANRITTFPGVDKHPAWSPDGALIAFFRGDCGFNCASHIYTAAPDGTGVTQLTFGQFTRDRMPDWSPDGGRIVFNREDAENNFWIMNRDGSGKTRIFGPHQQPAWSPDGTRIAHGAPGIGHMNVDGSDPQLTFADGTLPDWQPLGPRPSDYTDRRAFCEAARAFLGREEFRREYGNFRKCVKQKN